MVDEGRLPIFRERLNEVLGDRSITDFAKRVGISRQTLGFYLNGKRIPDIDNLERICSLSRVSADWLIGLSDVKYPDITVQAISTLTGLSGEAVEGILDCYGECESSAGIDALLSGVYLPELNNNIIEALSEQEPHQFNDKRSESLYADEMEKSAIISADSHVIADLIGWETWCKLDNAGLVVLGPNESKLFYKERVLEIVRDFLEGRNIYSRPPQQSENEGEADYEAEND